MSRLSRREKGEKSGLFESVITDWAASNRSEICAETLRVMASVIPK